MDASTDLVGRLNALIAELLPVLNQQLPAFIVDEGLDPMETVVSGSDTLGKIDLGICKAEVKANYSITDMKGLSSLYIKSLTVTVSVINGGESTSEATELQGTVAVSAELQSSLSANVSGSIEASCGGISEKAGISGKVTAKGVTGTGTADYTATFSATQSCFSKLHITDLNLNYKDIDVSIDGLGVFNEFLQPLVDAINALFGSYIKDELSSVVKNVLNDLLDDTLPYCIAY